jgi:hypothetical protein
LGAAIWRYFEVKILEHDTSSILESSPDLVALRAFLFAHVESYEQLTVLLLLYRSDDARTVTLIASELKVDARETKFVVDRLVASKLVTLETKGEAVLYRYSPGSQDLALQVQALAAAYEDNQVRLVELMTANAIERMRTNALRAFADGFRWRGSKKDG